ncbi:MAG: helix-turn-helix domain-containing protein [Myxococcales bacterium]|nr:helix-turn-helix domain-containing protein [Myxococcales bacterium]
MVPGKRDHLLRVAQVAELLGVCRATVYRLCERGELPHVRLLNAVRFDPVAIEQFLMRSRTKR